MQEAETGYGTWSVGASVPEINEDNTLLPTAGLNGIHLDAIVKLMDKLDKVAENWGTHVIGEAKFEVFDGNGAGVTIVVSFNDELSLHYLSRVAS